MSQLRESSSDPQASGKAHDSRVSRPECDRNTLFNCLRTDILSVFVDDKDRRRRLQAMLCDPDILERIDEPENNGGFTPLQLAISHSNYLAARMLVEVGADPFAGKPRTAICKALSSSTTCRLEGLLFLRWLLGYISRQGPLQRVRLAALLNDEKKPILKCLATAESERPKITRLVIEHGADVAARLDATGSTALHLAAREDNSMTAYALLEKGADPNARDDHGMTPLHVAAKEGACDTAMVLLIAGADPLALGRNVEDGISVATPAFIARLGKHNETADHIIAWTKWMLPAPDKQATKSDDSIPVEVQPNVQP
ncbi:hypothetical protein [Mollivirus kamchatka]|nr:hypothetical protein [Mollivirus kamchatka]